MTTSGLPIVCGYNTHCTKYISLGELATPFTVQFQSIHLSHVTEPSDETKLGRGHTSQGCLTKG